MDRNEVSNRVKEIFFNVFQKEENKLGENYWTNNFFGSKMHLLPGDVVAFLYTIENEFNLRVPSFYIMEGKFNTLESVIDIICDILQKKENQCV